MKTPIHVRFSDQDKMDAPDNNTIDLRPLCEPDTANQDTYDTDEETPLTEKETNLIAVSNDIVSPALTTENKRRKELSDAEVWKNWKQNTNNIFLRICTLCIKRMLVFFAAVYEKLLKTLRAREQWGVDFETRYDEKTLFYLAISLPATVKTAEDVLIYYPLMSRNHRYKLLTIRKNKLSVYRNVFEK